MDRVHGALIGALLRGAVMRHLVLEARRGGLCRVVRDARRIDMGVPPLRPVDPGVVSTLLSRRPETAPARRISGGPVQGRTPRAHHVLQQQSVKFTRQCPLVTFI